MDESDVERASRFLLEHVHAWRNPLLVKVLGLEGGTKVGIETVRLGVVAQVEDRPDWRALSSGERSVLRWLALAWGFDQIEVTSSDFYGLDVPTRDYVVDLLRAAVTR